MTSIVLCGGLAVISGLVMAIAMNFLAWMGKQKDELQWRTIGEEDSEAVILGDADDGTVKHGDNRGFKWTGQKLVEIALFAVPVQETPTWKSWLWFTMNLFLQLASVGFFIYACKWGPVALAMPLETATLLLSNLALQVLLGMERFDQVRFAGTLVLTCAACCLGDVGPVDQTPADANNEYAVELLWEPTSKYWIAVLVMILLISCIMMSKSEPGSTRHTLGWSLFVAIATAVGAAIGKFLTFTTTLLFDMFFVGYAICGVGSLYFGALAATKCDLVLFMGSNECFKLIITAITGVYIWNDTPSKLLTYIMVYILMCIGTYIVYLGEVGKPIKLNKPKRPTLSRVTSPLTNPLIPCCAGP